MKIFSSFLRYILTTLLVVSFLVTQTYAAVGDCAIKTGMSEELSTYIKTMNNLLSKTYEEASKKQCDTNAKGENSATASIDKTTSAVVGSMNEAIGFSNFYTSSRFYIGIGLKTEIPAGITRDHERLGKEIERINNAISFVHSRCAEDIVPSSNISEDPVYLTTGKSLGLILKEVLQNQVDLMNFYRETVLGDKVDDKYTFILVGNSKDFMSKLQKSYGPSAFNNCVNKSDFFKKIKDAFNRITTLGGGIQAGMKSWEEAFALLNSNSADKKRADTERNVLRLEMSTQGMSIKGSQVVMNNLAKYNSQNASEGVSGFISSVGDRVYSSIEQFEKTYDELKNMLTKPQTTDKYMETTRVLMNLKSDVNDEIIKDYEQAKSNIGPENQNTDEIIGKLLDTHILLESTNTFVKPYIKVSEQTCNAQDTGKGNCYFR